MQLVKLRKTALPMKKMPVNGLRWKKRLLNVLSKKD
jgi:hypothetical protein